MRFVQGKSVPATRPEAVRVAVQPQAGNRWLGAERKQARPTNSRKLKIEQRTASERLGAGTTAQKLSRQDPPSRATYTTFHLFRILPQDARQDTDIRSEPGLHYAAQRPSNLFPANLVAWPSTLAQPFRTLGFAHRQSAIVRLGPKAATLPVSQQQQEVDDSTKKGLFAEGCGERGRSRMSASSWDFVRS